jgi:predicted nucleic acid-binding protein
MNITLSIDDDTVAKALIVAIAQKSACRVLLTEDMRHGQKIGDLRIINPFLQE